MADARTVLPPKFELYRSSESIALCREGKYLLRVMPRELKFQVDILDQGSEA